MNFQIDCLSGMINMDWMFTVLSRMVSFNYFSFIEDISEIIESKSNLVFIISFNTRGKRNIEERS